MDKVKMNKYQSMSIQTVRAIATIFIVLCHILQGIDNLLAWWFNIGVQIFLCMSGFLLGNNDIEKVSTYINKRLKRILVPYYIFIIAMIIIYIASGINFSKGSLLVYALGIQGFKHKYIYTLPGIAHLWFISIILVCYFLAIILCKYKVETSCYSEKKFYIRMIQIFIVMQVFILWSMDFEVSFAPWIAAFIFGYFISYRYEFNIPNSLLKKLTILIIIGIPIRIYYQYFVDIENQLFSWFFNELYIPWSHMLLGVFLFVLLYKIFYEIYRKQLKFNVGKFIGFLDKYSYEIYLTHQVFILGPFSLLFISNFLILNITIILILVILCSILLKKVSSLVYSILKL